jgi:hypothetical protein
MENKQFNQITFDNMPGAVAKVYQEVSIIKNTLDELQQKFEPKLPTEYLTRAEVAEMFKCDISTVGNWTKKRILIKYCIANRVYYKRSEVEAALVKI